MSTSGAFDAEAARFYRPLLNALQANEVPFLVGGSFAATCYTGRERATKDLDIFVHRADCDRVAAAIAPLRCVLDIAYPHWLAKVHGGALDLDVIFSSGNGISDVDDAWFAHAGHGQLLGLAVRIPPVEEMIWSKAFVMERERYDGADVAHLLRAAAHRLDWARLTQRFGPHWRVLLSHVLLYTFVYPSERHHVPADWLATLLDRVRAEHAEPPPTERICQGTLLSRAQYLPDVYPPAGAAYRDARCTPLGGMTPQQIELWTRAIAPQPPGD